MQGCVPGLELQSGDVSPEHAGKAADGTVACRDGHSRGVWSLVGRAEAGASCLAFSSGGRKDSEALG